MNLMLVIVGSIIVLIDSVITGVGWNWDKLHKQNKMIYSKEDNRVSQKDAGNILVSGINGPAQISVGSPGSVQIVNQQRKILPQTKIEKGKEGNNFLLRIVLTQSPGIWDQGTDFKIQVKTTGPFESSRIVKGFPPAQLNVRISENKGEGYYAYATSTVPIKDDPIVLEILSTNEIGISQLGIEPLQQ